ncbi:MAG: hypothetical protein ACUVXB_18065, partial [Bryobacteraceae bacterium]
MRRRQCGIAIPWRRNRRRDWSRFHSVASAASGGRRDEGGRTHPSPLREHPCGVLSYADELSGLFEWFGAYRSGRGEDRQFSMSAWSGEGIRVVRVQERVRAGLERARRGGKR